MALPQDFRELLAEFDREEVSFVLIGGYAVAFHGRPREEDRCNMHTSSGRPFQD